MDKNQMSLAQALIREQQIYEGIKARKKAARDAEAAYWAWLDNSELSEFSENELKDILENLEGTQDASES